MPEGYSRGTRRKATRRALNEYVTRHAWHGGAKPRVLEAYLERGPRSVLMDIYSNDMRRGVVGVRGGPPPLIGY